LLALLEKQQIPFDVNVSRTFPSNESANKSQYKNENAKLNAYASSIA